MRTAHKQWTSSFWVRYGGNADRRFQIAVASEKGQEYQGLRIIGNDKCRYAADSWNRERRVIFKAEVVRLGDRDPRDNARFVVTNLRRVPRRVYEAVYCQRANIENRIKELLYGLSIDRTSCTSFWANQMRTLLTAAAYVLMQELRLRAAGTSCARAQVSTLRERLSKLGAWFQRSVRRVVIHLPDHAPWRSEWCRIARALGALPP